MFHMQPLFADADQRPLEDLLQEAIVSGQELRTTVFSYLVTSPLLTGFLADGRAFRAHPHLQRYLIFLFLTCLRRHSLSVGLPNIVSDYFADGRSLDFVWVFPELFCPNRISLNRDALTLLVRYTLEHSRVFPRESLFILISFVDEAFHLAPNIEDFIPGLTAIHFFAEKVVQDPISGSPILAVWRRLLLACYGRMSEFPAIGSALAPLFMFGLTRFDASLQTVQTATVFMFFALLDAIPFSRNIAAIFLNPHGLYRRYPSPVHGRLPDVDRAVFDVCARSWDVECADDFHRLFLRLRKAVLFAPERLSRCAALCQCGPFPHRAARLFVKTSGRLEIFTAPNPTRAMQRFFALFAGTRLTVPQEIVLSMFLPCICARAHGLLAAHQKDVLHFVRALQCPFVLPAAFLKPAAVVVHANAVLEYRPEMLAHCFDTLSTCIDCISASDLLRGPFLAPLSAADDEPSLDRRACLYRLAPESAPAARTYVRCGSPRVIRAVLAGPAAASLYSEALSIVGRFLIGGEDRLWRAAAPAPAAFAIVAALRAATTATTATTAGVLAALADAAGDDPARVAALFAVVNDAIDIVRIGARVRARTHENAEVEVDGVVDAIDAQWVSVGGARFVRASVRAVPDAVDLAAIADFGPFMRLFRVDGGGSAAFEVFRSAALASFLRVPAFVDALPDWLEVEPPRDCATFRGEELAEFTELLEAVCYRSAPFGFVSQGRRPVRGSAGGGEMRRQGKAMLCALDECEHFNSSPVALRAAFRF
jgi:hypothetical protein